MVWIEYEVLALLKHNWKYVFPREEYLEGNSHYLTRSCRASDPWVEQGKAGGDFLTWTSWQDVFHSEKKMFVSSFIWTCYFCSTLPMNPGWYSLFCISFSALFMHMKHSCSWNLNLCHEYMKATKSCCLRFKILLQNWETSLFTTCCCDLDIKTCLKVLSKPTVLNRA